MKIHLSVPDSPYFVRRYKEVNGKPYLTINDEDFSTSLILHGHERILLADAHQISDLSTEFLNQFAEKTPQLLLIGTGITQSFLDSSSLLKLASFIQRQIGIEVMSTASAARTYNILAQEGRDVVGIFFL
jgi:uncharacterized protein